MRFSRRPKLPNVTLVCVAGVEIIKATLALLFSMFRVKFGKIVFVTPYVRSTRWLRLLGVELHAPFSSSLDSMKEYNRYIVYELHRHIDTSHCLLIQADGYVLESSAWSDEFLNYDYVGAPWPLSRNSYIDPFGQPIRVGNGGFSLRSKKLLTVPLRKPIIFEVNSGTFYKHFNHYSFSEDGVICVHNRHLYLEDGCVFAPLTIAAKFSRELYVEGISREITFGFHKFKHLN